MPHRVRHALVGLAVGGIAAPALPSAASATTTCTVGVSAADPTQTMVVEHSDDPGDPGDDGNATITIRRVQSTLEVLEDATCELRRLVTEVDRIDYGNAGGSSTLILEEPDTFAPGKTAEGAGVDSEIETVVENSAGILDRVILRDADGLPGPLRLRHERANWRQRRRRQPRRSDARHRHHPRQAHLCECRPEGSPGRHLHGRRRAGSRRPVPPDSSTLHGGPGNDTLVGTPGFDFFRNEPGDDAIDRGGTARTRPTTPPRPSRWTSTWPGRAPRMEARSDATPSPSIEQVDGSPFNDVLRDGGARGPLQLRRGRLSSRGGVATTPPRRRRGGHRALLRARWLRLRSTWR